MWGRVAKDLVRDTSSELANQQLVRGAPDTLSGSSLVVDTDVTNVSVVTRRAAIARLSIAYARHPWLAR